MFLYFFFPFFFFWFARFKQYQGILNKRKKIKNVFCCVNIVSSVQCVCVCV